MFTFFSFYFIDLRFDPACCGPSLFISDENTTLKKNVDNGTWYTCRIANAEWNKGAHYWSMRILDKGAGIVMIGIVPTDFNTSLAQYPGQTANSYAFYVWNGTKYGSGSATGFTTDLPKSNDVIGVLLDLEARTLTYFKNGQIIGTAFGEIPIQDNIKYSPAIGLHSFGAWVSLIKTIK